MVRKRVKATSKASLIRALRATGKIVGPTTIKVVKRATKETVGVYSVLIRRRKRR